MKKPLSLLFIAFTLLHSVNCIAGDGNKFIKSVKPVFDFDQRFFYIDHVSKNTWGERAGLLINQSFKMGVGGYYMNPQSSSNLSGLHPLVTQSKLEMYFGTLYFEKFLLRRKLFEISFPIELGYGIARIKDVESSTGNLYSPVNRNMIPSGASLSVSIILPPIGNFKPSRWVGINFLGGYRYCLFQKQFDTDFNGWFWSISGAIFIDRVFDDVRAWQAKRAALQQ